MTPDSILHYRIEKKLGEGGMGEVFLATDTKLDRKVALKFLPPYLSKDPEFKSRFEHEARAAAALNHPNIVTIYDLLEHEGQLFIAMEYVGGESLEALIERDDVSVERAVEIAQQVAEGLHEAHEAGIVHRDIKPSNIVIDTKGRARILDFGLAKSHKANAHTKTGTTVGTLQYESPEQVLGKPVDQRTDLYSLGAVLYQMIAGRTPFAGEFDEAIRYAILNEQPEPLTRYKANVPPSLQDFVSKALEKDVEMRYQTAAGMLADLKRIGKPAISAPRHQRRATVWAAAAVVALIAAAGGYAAYTRYFAVADKGVSEAKRVVVLPFKNLGDREQEYFADGITEEVMSRLTSVNDVAVVSRMSSGRYKNTEKSIREIGQELGVEYVLDGTIRWQETSSGERRIRVVTQLIRVQDDVNVWSKSYDTIMTEFFAVQSDIAQQVSENMGITLKGPEKEAVWTKWTNSEEAYDLYLRGRQYAWRDGGYGEKPLRLGLDLFLEAYALDSNFAAACNQISQMYSRLYFFGFERSDSTRALARNWAERTNALTDRPWTAHFAMGEYYYRCLRDYKNALAEYDIAYRENRNSVNYLNTTHHVLRRMGEWDAAYENMKRVVELNPKNTIHKYDLATDCQYMRKFEEAERLLDEVIRLRPDFFEAYGNKVSLYLTWKGDVEAARDVIEQSRGKVDASRWERYSVWVDRMEKKYEQALTHITLAGFDSADYYHERGLMYHRMGRREEARVQLDSALELLTQRVAEDQDNVALHGTLGMTHAALEQSTKALEHGHKAVDLMPLSKDALDGSNPLLYMLQISVLLGDLDLAIAYVDSLLAIPSPLAAGDFLFDPDLAVLLDHPHCEQLFRKYADEEILKRYLERNSSS